jgi:hypothetical protein
MRWRLSGAGLSLLTGLLAFSFLSAQGPLPVGSPGSPGAAGATGATGATGPICGSSGQMIINSSSACAGLDLPQIAFFPAANCPGGSPGQSWSQAAPISATCRAGSNNIGGYISITDTSSTFAQFQAPIPLDWETSTNPYIRVGLISVSDTTNGHTVIPQIQVSCPTAQNGTVSDDHAFATAHALTTITFGGSAVANGFYTTSVQMNSTDMTGCVAGGFMIVQVGRSTDTATGVIGFEYASITWPRLPAVQAN